MCILMFLRVCACVCGRVSALVVYKASLFLTSWLSTERVATRVDRSTGRKTNVLNFRQKV